MTRNFKTVAILGLILFVSIALFPAYSQTGGTPPAALPNLSTDLSTLPRSVLGFNLIDRSRMSFSHQFMSVYSSGTNGMSALYFNTMTYQVSDPLTLRIHLGYAFQPMASRYAAYNQSQQVIPGFELDYRPWGGKLNLHIGYNTPEYFYRPMFYTPYNLHYVR